MIVEGADDFQARQHAKYAIELAAIGLGVQVAAYANGGLFVFAAGAAREHIAHLIDGKC